MDDLLSEFLTETTESLDSLDSEVVKLEQDPNDPDLLSNIFRLVHTIKGTCGFLGLPRLEAVAHSAENVLGKFREGELEVDANAVSLILASLDRIKSLLATLEATEAEPEGNDADLIALLDAMAAGKAAPAAEAKAEDAAPAPVEKEAPAASSKPLIERVGGISAVDAAVELLYRKVMKDSELTHFFDGIDMTLLHGHMVEFMVAAFGGPDNYSGADMATVHKGAVEHGGLDETHFAKVAGYLEEALVELEVAEDVIAEALAVVATTHDAVLNIDGAPKQTEAKAMPEAESEEASVNMLSAATEETETRSAVAAQSVRVTVDLLENLMTMVSELVLSRNQLLQILRQYEDSEFAAPLQRLNLVTTDLQEAVMKTRMQPIGNAWSKLPRIVRDLSQELGKKIDLQMVGADTELDRQVLEMIKDPLTHMVRNSGDHGIELPAVRVAAGKPETGKIVLNAYHEGGHIIIEIKDDGRGINIDKVRQKVISNGLATEAEVENMSETQIQQYVFKAGFSTADKVTAVSGRGVGMDVVRTNVEKIGGHIELKSEEGKGSRFVVKIPLTLAIVSALIVECAGERFAFPQISVDELVRVSRGSEHRIERINDTPVLRLRNRLLPLVALDELLQLREKQGVDLSPPVISEAATDVPVAKADAAAAEGAPTKPAVAGNGGEDAVAAESSDAVSDAETFIVVSRVGTYSFGIIVDGVFESEEIVVKPVTPILREISIFSGNTILGDGSVIMILDPNGIAAASGEISIAQTDQSDEAAAVDAGDGDRMTFLVFRAGNEEPKAVPLSLVARLEEIERAKIEDSGGMPVVQYRGQLMPLITIDQSFKMVEEGRQHVVVFSDGDHNMGLMVDEIVDIVEDRLNMELSSERNGIMGTAVIAGKATEVIDTSYYLTRAFGDWFAKAPNDTSDGAQAVNRILLIDDSPFFRNLLTPLLSVAGYDVTAVDGGEQALALLETGENFDVIISDIEMPGMSGFEFAKAVRQDDRWQEIPLVALSGFSSQMDLEKGRAVGFTDYVAKLDRDALLQSLSQSITNIRGAA